jgi:two-component system sensor histidine kinase KdpD
VAAVRTGEAEPPAAGRWADYLWSALTVALLTLAAKAAEPWIGYPSIDLFYLVPVILAATLFGLGPGIATGIASGAAYNFFFLPPHYTLHVHDPQDVVTAIVLVLVAVVTSQLAGRVRAQARAGERSARENAAIAGFVTTLGTLSGEAETARAICSEIARMFDLEAVMLRRDGASPEIAASHPGVASLEPEEMEAVETVFRTGERAGLGTLAGPASAWQFWPLKGSLGILAVLGVARSGAKEPVPPDRFLLFAQVLDRAARACERLKVEAEVRHAAALRERDRLRTTLLSSIGHDLRTPLTAVTAAAEALASDVRNRELVTTIRGEAARLNRFFDDLIDVARIEAGVLAPKPEAVDLTDAVAAALEDLRLTLAGRPVRLEVPADLPLVRTDPSLLHHILINLLDNSAKFSPDPGEILLRGEKEGGGVRLSVLDHGPGLPPGREEAVFDTFTRLEGSDRTGGTGLGLAIVKGFAEAMGLGVEAANRADTRGSRFSILFPAASVIAPGGKEE